MALGGIPGGRERSDGSGVKESAEGNPGKIGDRQRFITTSGLAGALRTKAAVGARTGPARGKGSSELGTGALRQAGPAGWAVKTATRTTSNCERIKEATV